MNCPGSGRKASSDAVREVACECCRFFGFVVKIRGRSVVPPHQAVKR